MNTLYMYIVHLSSIDIYFQIGLEKVLQPGRRLRTTAQPPPLSNGHYTPLPKGKHDKKCSDHHFNGPRKFRLRTAVKLFPGLFSDGGNLFDLSSISYRSNLGLFDLAKRIWPVYLIHLQLCQLSIEYWDSFESLKFISY